ncbi:MFS transporter [Alteraurantiacibacter buctensis]|uniref:MFS transporter n=1 Tax=Alteraurantiacibacter buctensis TaxID=1503981 RepID=A0A844Z0S0_9SPHN|nr:MFS transporter [Alteraurantiacibacter buctensis]MXO71987.1 MFS transporter [Alteraurantiacibacter buctensis]
MTATGTAAGSAKDMEQIVGGRVLWRLVLPCALYILVGAIDRTNVGFAALHMNAELGLSSSQYGFGAGVLFVGYVLAKYPSVLVYEALGLRKWLALISFVWGLAACAMAAIQTDWHLYALRVLIGFAEGGLSSGLMIYLSHWATERWRATILAIPIMSISVAQVIGAPLSGVLLDLDQPLGMSSWRFMFLVEGLPALGLALFALLYFVDRPTEARWLSPDQRTWLAANTRGAADPKAQQSREGRWDALKSPVGWTCAAIWFCILASNYGIIFWLPQIVSGMAGLTPTQTGLVVALPNFATAIGLVLNARHSDKTGERVLHVAIPALAGGIGLVVAYLVGPGLPGLAMLIIGGACTGCTVAAFWAIPTKLLPPQALAMGVVMINMVGSFAGATVPAAMGWLRDQSGSFLPPTLLLLGIATVCATLCLVARRQLRQLDATA